MEPTPEHKRLHPLAQLAKDTVESHVKSGYMVTPRELTPEMRERAGVFVSIKKSGMLRGCIGTFEPRQSNVAEEITGKEVQEASCQGSGDVPQSRTPPTRARSLALNRVASSTHVEM